MCKLSIIVPIYNVEKYLEKCVNSILAQTFTDFELILVNDGSLDDCLTICNTYANIDKRVKVINKENGGLSSARNAGLKLAKGDYIAFVDSDDFIHKEMYQILYSYGIKNSSTLVICDYMDVEEDRMYDTNYSIQNFKEENYTNIEALSQLYSNKGVMFVVACNKIFKKDLFYNLRFEEGKIHEDEFIAAKILFACSKVTYLPINLYFYLQRSNGIVRSPFNIRKLDAVEAYKERIDFFRNIKQTELTKKAEYNYITLFFLYYFKTKKEVPNSKKRLKNIKKDFCGNLGAFIKNPYFIWKEKISWILFAINPFLYEILFTGKRT